MTRWCAALDAAGRPAGEGADAAFTWCHVDARDEAARRWLETEAGLPSPVLHALLAVETRPRCEAIDAGALVNLRGLGATPGDDPDPLVSIRLWAERGRAVSVALRTISALAPVQAAMERGAVRDPGDLVSALAVEITRTLDPEVVKLGDAIDACEESLDADQAWLNRRQIARARSLAISYRRFVVPQRQALERLAELDADWLEEDDRLHLRGAADRFARMAEELEAVRERSALLHEQLSDLRSELIETRSLLLSIVALVFLPLTFLTGLFGMNVGGIPFAEHPHGFEWLLLICLLLSVAISAFFIRAHWLRR